MNPADPSGTNGASIGPVIGTIIILAVIVLGGLYFWSQRAENQAAVERTIQDIEKQSDSDATSAIEADLEATEIDSLDASLEL